MEHTDILDELAEVLKEQGSLWIPAQGFSMGTRWRDADALEIEAVDGADLERFDVAVFRRGDVWVAHRVVKMGRRVGAKRSEAPSVPAEPHSQTSAHRDGSPYLKSPNVGEKISFTTKGDGMWHLDADRVSADQVVGRVKALRFGARDVAVVNRLGWMEWVRLWVGDCRIQNSEC